MLKRYVDQIAGRVLGMGGDPGKIIPTQDGNWNPGGRSKDFEPRFKGKILGLLYDHFGDSMDLCWRVKTAAPVAYAAASERSKQSCGRRGLIALQCWLLFIGTILAASFPCL